MASVVGLDFGTTNSLISFVEKQADVPVVRALTHLEDNRPHPSVVWYSADGPVVGRSARDQLSELGIGVFGDVVRSPKTFLGSPVPVVVDGVERSAIDIVAEVLQHLRTDALARGFREQDFSRAVVTVPVTMEGRAREDLRQAANRAGFRIHQFVHEPMAALYGYLRAMQSFRAEVARLEGRCLLVFDWGGGTLDLTLCQVLGGTLVQILNLGDRDVGGDKFDLRVLDLVKAKHSELHPGADWRRLQPTAEKRLLRHCEDAKIALSDRETTNIFLRDVLQGTGSDLEVTIARSDLRAAVGDLVERGLSTIGKLLGAVGLPVEAVDFCLVTGGMAAVPAIREALVEVLGGARVREPDNSATIISEGAGWIAYDDAEIRLAKPLEFLHASNQYVEAIAAHAPLPREGGQVTPVKMGLYCVDPSDGFAKIQIARPRWPGRVSAMDDRVPYATLCVEVDPDAPPLRERLELGISVDENLIAHVGVLSTLSSFHKSVEIHDLEFGLALARRRALGHDQDTDDSEVTGEELAGPRQEPREQEGAVRIRSNVSDSAHNWNHVPGEIVGRYSRGHDLTARQRDEKMYYVPCMCGLNAYQIERFGCDSCAAQGKALSREEASRRWQRRDAERRGRAV